MARPPAPRGQRTLDLLRAWPCGGRAAPNNYERQNRTPNETPYPAAGADTRRLRDHSDIAGFVRVAPGQSAGGCVARAATAAWPPRYHEHRDAETRHQRTARTPSRSRRTRDETQDRGEEMMAPT